MKSTPKAAIVLDKRRPTKNNKYPVKIRITYFRKYRYYSVLDCYFKNEDELNEVFKKNPKVKYKKYRNIFDKHYNTANRIIDELGSKFSFDLFRKKYLQFISGSPVSGINDFYYHINNYIDELEKNNRYNYAQTYKSTLNNLKAYRTKLTFPEITTEFLQNFENFLLQKGNSKATIGIYTRNIRCIFNKAIREGDISKDIYPFGKFKYKIHSGRNIKKALTLSEIKKIFYYETIPTTTEDWAKDMWIFSYITNGMNMADIARLKYRNIKGDYIVYSRHKTRNTAKGNERQTQALLTDKTREIIRKHGNIELPEYYIFPIIHDNMTPEQQYKKIKQAIQQVNKYMKRIAKACDINKKVTTYYARHSFASILNESNVPLKFIYDSLLHHDIKQTENYIDSLKDDAIKNYIGKLTEFDNIE